jgi:hypothetical protein
MDELAKDERAYKRLNEIIKLPGTIADESNTTRLVFFTDTPQPQPTVADLLKAVEKPILAMKSEFIENKKADVQRVAEVTAEKVALETAVAAANTALKEEQTRHTTDVNNLTKEVTDANALIEKNRLEATTAIQRLAIVEEEKKREEARLTREVVARDERIRQDKAVRDLEIRRDDPDGQVLAASPTMMTGTVNIGRLDRAFPGLKLAVSQIGRGGLREPKGEIMIHRVTGPHSSTFSILSQLNPETPIGQGDIVHNPLYNPTETLHIWFAGDLERYPKHIARERLSRMGVVVDDELNAETDYVVIPGSMKAPAPTEAPADGEEGAAPPAGRSEAEKIEAMARNFGATVITEEMLNHFLDY